MAMKKHSAKKRHPGKRGLRNAVAAAPAARSRTRAERVPQAAAPAHHVVVSDVAKVGLGMLGGGALCALVEREDWLPPWLVTSLAAATGLGLAAAGNDTQKMVGYGVMGGAVVQYVGTEILGGHDKDETRSPDAFASRSTPAASRPASGATTPPPSTPLADTHRQSSFEGFGLPPGALETAYQRARERLAMENTSDAMR